jgi:diguanylate cyclase (GGDEF)-like protein
MRIGRGVDGSKGFKDITNEKYNIAHLYSEIEYLKPMFESIMLVNPFDKCILSVGEFGLKDIKTECSSVCPLSCDTCGCICKDTISTGENRCRYIFNKKEAHLIISKKVKMLYRDYVLVLDMKISPTFQFGVNKEEDAIEQITKIGSNLVLDPLTKIFNRKYVMDNSEFIVKNAILSNSKLCLACIDIDNFKRFNDSYGHEFGDKVLKSVANNMVEATKVIEDVHNIRIGGDEFIIIASNIDKQRFKAIMNKLCIMIDNTKLKFKNNNVGIKISIGVGEVIADEVSNYKELYDVADRQLYVAKEAGKGCVR